MEEKRSNLRISILNAGTIAFGGALADRTIGNLSTSGVLLDVESPLGSPHRFTLTNRADQVPRSCRLIWAFERRVGALFDRGVNVVSEQKRAERRLKLWSAIWMTTLLLISLQTSEQALARSGMATERPWASEHIEGLPADIRRRIVAIERACGNAAAAAHYFAVSIEAGGQRFVSLHFEEFACGNRAVVCNGNGCLHEIYAESRGRYRIVFSRKALDVRMTNAGGIAGLEVSQLDTSETYRWNGRGFTPVRTERNGP